MPEEPRLEEKIWEERPYRKWTQGKGLRSVKQGERVLTKKRERLTPPPV